MCNMQVHIGWLVNRKCNILDWLCVDGGAVGFVQACTSDGDRGWASEAQGRAGGPRGAGSCEDGSDGARIVVGSPGAGRASARTPSVELGVAVSQQSSQSAATNETILRDGHGVCQVEERRGSGFRRATLAVVGPQREVIFTASK